MRFLDFFGIRLVIFLISFILLSFIMKSVIIVLILSLAITFILSLFVSMFKRNTQDGYDAFIKSAIFGGNEYVFDIVKNVLDGEWQEKNNYLILGDQLIFNCLRFGNISADEIVRCHNAALSENADTIYLIGKSLDRRCNSVANAVSTKFIFISAKHLYKLALKANLLAKEPTTKQKIKVSAAFSFALSRANAKRYLFSAAVLAFMSVFTPLKTYYLVISGISLLLTLLCLSPIGNNEYSGKKGVFDKPRYNKEK